LLLMEEQHMKFWFHTSGLAVCMVLRCKQHSLEQPTEESVMVVGRVILVDAPHSVFSNSIKESTYVNL
jgi:hypothetical protein